MNDKTKELLASAACVLIGAVTLLLGFFLGSQDKQPRKVQVYETNWISGVHWRDATNWVTETNYLHVWQRGVVDHDYCNTRYGEMVKARDWNMDLREMEQAKVSRLELELDTVKSLLCIERDKVTRMTNQIFLLNALLWEHRQK